MRIEDMITDKSNWNKFSPLLLFKTYRYSIRGHKRIWILVLRFRCAHQMGQTCCISMSITWHVTFWKENVAVSKGTRSGPVVFCCRNILACVRVSLARTRSLFRPLLPSACYAGYNILTCLPVPCPFLFSFHFLRSQNAICPVHIMNQMPGREGLGVCCTQTWHDGSLRSTEWPLEPYPWRTI